MIMYSINTDYHDKTKFRFLDNAVAEGLLVEVAPCKHGNYARHVVCASLGWLHDKSDIDYLWCDGKPEEVRE